MKIEGAETTTLSKVDALTVNKPEWNNNKDPDIYESELSGTENDDVGLQTFLNNIKREPTNIMQDEEIFQQDIDLNVRPNRFEQPFEDYNLTITVGKKRKKDDFFVPITKKKQYLDITHLDFDPNLDQQIRI